MAGPDDPFGEIEELLDQITKFGGVAGSEVPVDVVDADTDLIVRADLPGRDPEQITVELDDSRRLAIDSGPPEGDVDGRYLTRERPEDSLTRRVTLPAAVDEDDTEARYDRGVLTIRMGKLTGEGDGTDIPVE